MVFIINDPFRNYCRIFPNKKPWKAKLQLSFHRTHTADDSIKCDIRHHGCTRILIVKNLVSYRRPLAILPQVVFQVRSDSALDSQTDVVFSNGHKFQVMATNFIIGLFLYPNSIAVKWSWLPFNVRGELTRHP